MTKILQKLHAIMADIKMLGKDKRNEFHGYNYLSEAAIKKAIHPLLVKYKVLFMVDTIDAQIIGDLQTKTGVQKLTNAKIIYKFFDTESGEVIEGKFDGYGADSGDKGLYKAITGAIKYILTSTFLIPTGDDPEKDEVHKATKQNVVEMFSYECGDCGAEALPSKFKRGEYYCPQCKSKNIITKDNDISKGKAVPFN